LLQAKRRAVFWLLVASGFFLLSLFLPPVWWQSAIKACAEAALVGGLADWFAVSALFRHIPIPLISGHTDILRRKQTRVAQNLAQFVRTHFFDRLALQRLLAGHDMAASAAAWLQDDAQRRSLSAHVQQAARGVLQSLDDAPIQRLLLQGLQRLLLQLDMRGALAALLAGLMREGRHQQLLDDTISHIAAYLARPETHGHFAQALSDWLQREYPKLQLVLPTEKLGKKGADMLRQLLRDFFTDIQHNPQHFVRLELQASLERLRQEMPTDPAWQTRLQSFQNNLAQHDELHRLVGGMAGDLRAWLLADLQADASRLRGACEQASLWLAQTLERDAALRASLNQHLQGAVLNLAPDIGAFLQTHIENTLAGWDSAQMVAQIEAQVGPDLQNIRINGTALGGAIGLGLWLLAQGAQWLSQLSLH
jgi:uncharacterized membrane-anchored protein YjiN (DUF445 family)